MCSDFLPLRVATVSEKLAAVGYQNHFVGKGHLGYQTMDHLPINRGFVSHVGCVSIPSYFIIVLDFRLFLLLFPIKAVLSGTHDLCSPASSCTPSYTS
jgi:hypothetical protein